MAFVRSFAHRNSGHGGGTHWVMTGYNFPPADNGIPRRTPTQLDPRPAVPILLPQRRDQHAHNLRRAVCCVALAVGGWDSHPRNWTRTWSTRTVTGSICWRLGQPPHNCTLTVCSGSWRRSRVASSAVRCRSRNDGARSLVAGHLRAGGGGWAEDGLATREATEGKRTGPEWQFAAALWAGDRRVSLETDALVQPHCIRRESWVSTIVCALALVLSQVGRASGCLCFAGEFPPDSYPESCQRPGQLRWNWAYLFLDFA
jgi:hypothetical protein